MPKIHDLDESPPRDAADLDEVAGLMSRWITPT
jgi:hypothetical protein